MPEPLPANLPSGMNLACNIFLADIVQRVESSLISVSLRFEPGIHARNLFSSQQMKQCKGANNCNDTTARILLSMSFGSFQIMGFNLYDARVCDFTGSVSEFLANGKIQRLMFERFCTANGIAYSAADMLNKEKREHFAKRYNGAGNVVEYSAKILDATHALGIK